MPDQRLKTCAYRVLRYVPNLVRDEWVNIGVLLHQPGGHRVRLRLIEEPAEFARVRRFHPHADLNVLRALAADLEAEFARHGEDPEGYLARLDETLSNLLQLGPQKGVLTEDVDAELERVYREQVAPPRWRARAAAAPATRHEISARSAEVFRHAGVWERIAKRVPVDEFTFKGDPMRMDFSYRRNGTRGFLHALSLAGDPVQAKVLAFTAERIREKLEASEFAAITEVEAQPENGRHQFVAGLLRGQGVEIVPLARLADYASELRSGLR